MIDIILSRLTEEKTSTTTYSSDEKKLGFDKKVLPEKLNCYVRRTRYFKLFEGFHDLGNGSSLVHLAVY